jgi:hypothetical protein
MTELEIWIKTLENLGLKLDVMSQDRIRLSGVIRYSPSNFRLYKIIIELDENREIEQIKVEFLKGYTFMHSEAFDTNYTDSTSDRFIKRHWREFRNTKLAEII